jgi:molybdopterin synthase sulfur carrier subunit
VLVTHDFRVISSGHDGGGILGARGSGFQPKGDSILKGWEVVEQLRAVHTVRDVAAWLAGRGEHYAAAFDNPEIVRAAIDRRHVKPETPIAGASEIAFFPPMTGG